MDDVIQNTRPYSLRKSRGIMKWVYSWYKRKGNQLPQSQLNHLEQNMSDLDQALLQSDKEKASQKAKLLEKFAKDNCKKSVFEYVWELIGALAVALVIALIVRSMWFEPYEIPTGSMRPTFREQDHLTVTKTAFGLNNPLETNHFYFDPNLVQRSSVLIFSGDGLPLPDVDTTYFGVLPYKKRYIKRAIGKPGDSIYFYGGRLYGVDKDGNDLTELRETPWMQNLEYVPFLSFDGVPVRGGPNTVLLRHMHIPYGRLVDFSGQTMAEVFDGKTWVKDQPMAQSKPHSTIQTYSDIFGMRNYAEARLLTKEELNKVVPDAKDIPEGVLYLQLRHTPSLSYPRPVDSRGQIAVTGYDTFIPLQQSHLDTLMDHLYTSRFVVSGGKAHQYSLSNHRQERIPMSGVPDGTYEFYFGKATKVNWGGIETSVSNDNPLYSHDPKNIQKIYNSGIDWSTQGVQSRFPNRYAYFRDGDLYLMGYPVVKKGDPVLVAFNEQEQKKEAQATAKTPYVAFKDYGPPMKDGKIDTDFIRTFGVKVPEGQYMVLGDNHAMSSDSRYFGFVPQNNLQGAPSLIVWPPGERLGSPSQKPYPFMNVPRAIVWSIAGVVGILWYIWHRRNLKKPIFVKKVTRPSRPG